MRKLKLRTIAMSIFIILGILATAVWAKGPNPDPTILKEGDVIFQTSHSRQAPLIRYATGSPISHCGIIVEKNGKLYVLEACGKVKLTSLDKWIDRGVGNSYLVRRPKKALNKKIAYSKYVGIPYDLQFKFNNGKYYCSELVYEIYLKDFGIKLCAPKSIKEYNTFGIEKEAKRRKMDLNQLVVAPSDLLNSDMLETVR